MGSDPIVPRGRSPISPFWENGSDLFSQNHLISGPWTNCRSATGMSRCPSTRLSSPPAASSPPLIRRSLGEGGSPAAASASLGVFSSLQVENPRKGRLRKSSRLHKSHNVRLPHFPNKRERNDFRLKSIPKNSLASSSSMMTLSRERLAQRFSGSSFMSLSASQFTPAS